MLSRRRFIQLGAAMGAGMVLPMGMAEKVFGFTLGGNPQPLPANPLLLTKFRGSAADRRPLDARTRRST